jgi:MFS family permease
LAFFNRREYARRFIYLGVTVFTVAEILFALSRNFALCVALLVVVGFFSTLFTTTSNTRILSLTPNELQGRVMSVYSLMFLGMTPFGSLVAGIVAQRWGAPVALAGGAAITLVFTILVYLFRPTRRHVPRAERVGQS